MSATVQQIYVLNPSTTIANGDLVYIVQSPYTPGTDSAIIGSDLKTMFLQPSNNLSDLSNPAAARNNLGLSVIATATPPLNPILGGTGVNNGASTITIGGSISFIGAFTFAGTLTGNTAVTFPTSGTLATTSQLLVSPLTTKGDIWVWSTTNDRLPVATGDGKVLQVSSVAATGLAYSTPTYPSASGTAGFILRSDGTNNVYSQSTFADLYAASSILYANGANNVAGLTTANNGLLVTGNTGIPSILAGPGTAGNVLQSNAAAAPSFSTATYPSTAGTSGNLMTSNGTNFISSAALFFKSINVQRITATGAYTYTPTAGIIGAIVELQAGGGGSGGVTGGTNQVATSGSGGGGGYLKFYVTAAQIGASISGSVGIAGTAATAGGGNNGGAGGNTTFVTASTWTAGGGGGGNGQTAAAGNSLAGTAGAGGTNTTGTGILIENLSGQAGTRGATTFIATITFGTGGTGGNSKLGFGGQPVFVIAGASTFAGNAGTGNGGGGSGSISSNNNAVTATGAAGAAGIVIITEFLSV